MEISIFYYVSFLKEMMNYARKKKMYLYFICHLYVQIGFWLKYILVALTKENLSVKKKTWKG